MKTTKNIRVHDVVQVTNSGHVEHDYVGVVVAVHHRSWLARYMDGENTGSYKVVPFQPTYVGLSYEPARFFLESPKSVEKIK